MFSLRGPSARQLGEILAASGTKEFSYRAVGATRSGELPAGYRHQRRSVVVGPASCFETAASGVRRWVAQIGSGFRVFPQEEVTQAGTDHLLLMRFVVVHVVAPMRVAYVVDEPARLGFAYGTLPGHP